MSALIVGFPDGAEADTVIRTPDIGRSFMQGLGAV
jgi:hypothetical protein